MSERAARAIGRLQAVLDSWDEVSAAGLHRHGDDVYDPYFSLSLDVYTRTSVRDASVRCLEFGEVSAFESSTLTRKDRFLMGSIPVHVEYKRTERFDELVAAAMCGECALRDARTYAFRRVIDAEILISRDGWLETVRANLTQLPDAFWQGLRAAQQATAEHLYSDLSAAAMRNDSFFFTATAGRFLVQLCSLLFSINRRFEPSPRQFHDEVLSLAVLPDSFRANVENFVSQEHGLTMAQRAELAELMVTSVLSL